MPVISLLLTKIYKVLQNNQMDGIIRRKNNIQKYNASLYNIKIRFYFFYKGNQILSFHSLSHFSSFHNLCLFSLNFRENVKREKR